MKESSSKGNASIVSISKKRTVNKRKSRGSVAKNLVILQNQ
jgi:hypothetical protein